MANKHIEKIKSLVNGNDDRKVIVASGGVLAVGAVLTSLGMFLAGLPTQGALAAPPEPEPVSVALPVVSAAGTPASALVDKLLEAPAKGWKTTGGRTEGASAPFPYTCPVAGGAPIMATSQPYLVGGKKAVLTVSVYGPGIGVKAAQQLANNAKGCAAGTGSTSQWASGDRQWTASSSLSGNSVRASMAQRGDVIIHVSSSSDTKSLVAQVAKTLDGKLTPKICVAPDAKLNDLDRNPNSGVYKPHTVRTTAKIADPGLPEVPADQQVQQVSLNEPIAQIDAVVPTKTPVWPVWPQMPAAIDLPTAPQLPEAEPVLAKKLSILAEDKKGPGCGWAFTGTSAPTFDKTQAERANAEDIKDAERELAEGAKTWADSVLTFWTEAAAYNEASTKYASYTQEVIAVNTAWAAIDSQWQTYNANLAAYEAREARISQLYADQAAARTEFDEKMRQCLTTQSEQTEHNRKLAEGINPLSPQDPLVDETEAPAIPGDNESESEPEAVDPLQPVEVIDCLIEVKRPVVLDEVAPPRLTMPTPPADPRPAPEEADPESTEAPSQP